MRLPASTRSRGSVRALHGWASLGTILILLSGCGPRVLFVESGPQAYYRTGAPMHDTSGELERTFRSLRRIVYSAAYQTYLFAADVGVTEGDLEDPAFLERAFDRLSDVESKGATAIIVARTDRRVALVTNDHVVRFPPVRVHYFDEDRARPRASRRIASVSVRTREWGWISGHPELGNLSVLARDSADDLAVFEVRLPEGTADGEFEPINAVTGDPRRLSWGSFVYVLGYPTGYPMVTRALVSDPNRDEKGGFLTDGLWNEGISGGPILAVRGDDGSLEWVGITRAAVGAREIRLQPQEPEPPKEDFGTLYQGPIYAEPAIRIQYGITLSVSMTAVREFVGEHRAMLRRYGYDMRRF